MTDERSEEFGEEKFGGGGEEVSEEEEEIEEVGEEMEEEEEEVGADDEFGAENEVRDGEELGEEGESYSVENDAETLSVSSSNKRITKMSIDRLSALPDALLIHILSYLGVKKAAITSVLSKRWRYLWTELPKLELEERSWATEKIREFVTRVHRTLVIRGGNYLEKFEVDFWYDKCFASEVNAWVNFAVKNKVKEVSLLLGNFEDDFYTLPELMFSNPSLTELCLRGCFMNPRTSIVWRSLTKLIIEDVELHEHVIQKILSGCPVLHSLNLRACWGFNCLEVKSRSLCELAIEDDIERIEPLLEISAPYIRSLDIELCPEDRQLRLRNIPSVVKARIDFSADNWDASEEEVFSNVKNGYEYLKHVEELELGWFYMQVLSELVDDGWQLPQSRLRRLVVHACREHRSISGIVGLLESSPNLEKLDIEGYDPDGASKTWSPPARDDLNCDLLNLKIVNITNLADPKFGGEPMLTLAQILLKRATVLEKMVIDVGKTTFSSRDGSSDFTNMAQTLLSYPRSSKNAQVILR